MIDPLLIERCRKGDAKAPYALYRALYGMMMGICRRYERDRQEAAALMNQAYLKILQGLDGRPGHVPFEPWARRIVINTVIDRFRRERQRREMERPISSLEDQGGSEVNEYLSTMEAEAFAVMLDDLPPTSREVFNLFAIDGYAHTEIAEMLGISVGTSKWHVNHARTLLQRAIAEMAHARTLNAPVR